MLGDLPVDYKTTSQEQSELIPEKGRYDNRLSPEAKLKLQSSQFILGNSKNDFSTDYGLEYYDKSSFTTRASANELKSIRDKLKGSNYDLGTDKLNYLSENAEQYTKPELDVNEMKKNKMQNDLFTKELRNGHIELGGDEQVPWNTSHRVVYTPKKLQNNRYDNKSCNQFSGINIGNSIEDRDFKSETMMSYNKKPLPNNRLSPDLMTNLRKNHFEIGDNNTTDMNTVNRIDYKDPRLDKDHNYGAFIVDPNKFRYSNWSLNGGCKDNYYNTTYLRTMTPKKPLPNDGSNNENLKNHIKIGGESNPEDYKSVYDCNYSNKDLTSGDYYLSNRDKNLANNIKDFNKKSHLEMFGGKGEYDTTMNDHYRYNIDQAKSAYSPLNPQSMLNLRSTHYQLGEGGEFEKETSNRRDYIPYPGARVERIASGIRNKETMKIGEINQGVFNGATIYMTDYTKKPMPRDDDELEIYLRNKYLKDLNQ